MGCGSSDNTTKMIYLDRPSGCYFAGEVVSGTLQLLVNDDKLEAGAIDLNLIGEAGFITQGRRTGNSQGTTTQHHHRQFLLVKQILARPNDGEKEVTLAKGQYTFPFQLQLPAHLPPPISSPQTYPHVCYYLRTYIEKRWSLVNRLENQYITVMPRVSLAQHPNCLTPTIFGNQNRKDVTVKGMLNKVGYLPGETIQGTIEIQNLQQVLIKQMNVALIRKCKIGPSAKHDIVTNGTMIEVTHRQDSQIKQPFSIPISATSLAPTYQFDGGITERTTIQVNYTLTFNLDVEGIFTDFEVVIPIVIANQ